MKVWVDVLTPKQVLFFKPLVDELSKRGHDVLATGRDYRELVGLSKLVNFDLKFVGRHGGPSLYEKLRISSERILTCAELVKSWMPDVAVSFSSPECARVAFGLGIKHVCVNDSPHAEKVARLTLPLSHTLFTPWVIPKSAWTKYGIEKDRIVYYKALDPAAWLKRERDGGGVDLPLDRGKRTIVVRLEEAYASYLLEYDRSSSIRLLNALSSLQGYNIIVLCRYGSQLRTVRREFEGRFIVPYNVVKGSSLLKLSDVFVGMGGTMTAEAALLGVPTISLYLGAQTYVERYLCKKGLVLKLDGVEKAVELVDELLKDKKRRAKLKEKAKRILDGMEDPIEKLRKGIEEQ